MGILIRSASPFPKKACITTHQENHRFTENHCCKTQILFSIKPIEKNLFINKSLKYSRYARLLTLINQAGLF